VVTCCPISTSRHDGGFRPAPLIHVPVFADGMEGRLYGPIRIPRMCEGSTGDLEGLVVRTNRKRAVREQLPRPKCHLRVRPAHQTLTVSRCGRAVPAPLDREAAEVVEKGCQAGAAPVRSRDLRPASARRVPRRFSGFVNVIYIQVLDDFIRTMSGRTSSVLQPGLAGL